MTTYGKMIQKLFLKIIKKYIDHEVKACPDSKYFYSIYTSLDKYEYGECSYIEIYNILNKLFKIGVLENENLLMKILKIYLTKGISYNEKFYLLLDLDKHVDSIYGIMISGFRKFNDELEYKMIKYPKNTRITKDYNILLDGIVRKEMIYMLNDMRYKYASSQHVDVSIDTIFMIEHFHDVFNIEGFKYKINDVKHFYENIYKVISSSSGMPLTPHDYLTPAFIIRFKMFMDIYTDNTKTIFQKYMDIKRAKILYDAEYKTISEYSLILLKKEYENKNKLEV